MKVLLFLAALAIIPATALAQFHDHDGHLQVRWSPPSNGNTPAGYIWSYTINGRIDSLTGTSPAADTTDNSVTLANIGDWAIFRIRAVSVVYDTSIWVVSDTAFYNTDSGIGPPRMVDWIQGP